MRLIRLHSIRLMVLALVALGAAGGVGDMLIPDVHAHGDELAVTGAGSHPDDGRTQPDGHGEHTCHCVHAHGVALLTPMHGLTTWGAHREARGDEPQDLTPLSTAPPFHPPKA